MTLLILLILSLASCVLSKSKKIEVGKYGFKEQVAEEVVLKGEIIENKEYITSVHPKISAGLNYLIGGEDFDNENYIYSQDFDELEGKIPFRSLSNKNALESIKPKNHKKEDEIKLGFFERKIMQEIEDKPLNILGELVDITNCPHDCNNQGVCQRHFIKTKTSENPDTYSYEPKFSCVCKANFKGQH